MRQLGLFSFLSMTTPLVVSTICLTMVWLVNSSEKNFVQPIELLSRIREVDTCVRLAHLNGETNEASKLARKGYLAKAIDLVADGLEKLAELDEPPIESDFDVLAEFYKRAALISFRLDAEQELGDPLARVNQALALNQNDQEAKIIRLQILSNAAFCFRSNIATSWRLAGKQAIMPAPEALHGIELDLLSLMQEEKLVPEALWMLNGLYRFQGRIDDARRMFLAWQENLDRFSLLLNWYEERYPPSLDGVAGVDGQLVKQVKRVLPEYLNDQVITGDSSNSLFAEESLKRELPKIPDGDYLILEEIELKWIREVFVKSNWNEIMSPDKKRLLFIDGGDKAVLATVVCVSRIAGPPQNEIWERIPEKLSMDIENASDKQKTRPKRLEGEGRMIPGLIHFWEDPPIADPTPEIVGLSMVRGKSAIWYLVFHRKGKTNLTCREIANNIARSFRDAARVQDGDLP